MANANTLSLPQSSTNQAPAESPTKKKKCSGTCENCLAKKRARLVNQQALPAEPTRDDKPIAESDPEEDVASEEEKPKPNVNKNQLHGIEFDGETHKGLWTGCFHGTLDF